MEGLREEIAKIIKEACSNYMLDMEKTKPNKLFADKIIDLINQRAEPESLVIKLIEVDSLIRCVHLDMGGNDKYHISPKNNDQIGKLIKECLCIAEGE